MHNLYGIIKYDTLNNGQRKTYNVKRKTQNVKRKTQNAEERSVASCQAHEEESPGNSEHHTW